MFIIFKLFFMLCFMIYIVHSQKWKCNKQSEKEIDEISSLLFHLGRDDRKFPENNNELKEYCKDLKKYVQKIETYKDQCLKNNSKQIVGILTYSMKTVINNYCGNIKAKRTQDLIRSANCANKNTHSYHQCHLNYIDILIEANNLKDNQQKLQQLCCGYVDVLNCIHERGLKEKSCNEKYVDANLNFIRSYFDGAINTLCGDYNEHNDKCDKIVRVQSKNKQTNRPKTFFQPIVDILVTI